MLLSELVHLADVHGLTGLRLADAGMETCGGICVALLDRVENPLALLTSPEADNPLFEANADPLAVAAAILQASEDGSGAVAKHVRPWCARHRLNADDTLLDYVRELCGAIVGGSDPLLEARCLGVLRCITEPAQRVDAALLLH